MLHRFLSALTGTALFLTLAISARAAGPTYPDLAGHWSQAEVEAAAQAGWVNGYPDGTFRPDDPVSRAEFIKLLLGAVRLTPDSGAAAFLHQASQASYHPLPLDDMGENWLTQAGWTQVAWEFGLIQAGDFPDRQFGPAVPLTRGEAGVDAAWEPDMQEIEVNYILPYRFRAGDTRYVGFGYAEIDDNSKTFPVPARILYGELMIPMYSPGSQRQQNLWGKSEWDASEKIVTIHLWEKYPPTS